MSEQLKKSFPYFPAATFATSAALYLATVGIGHAAITIGTLIASPVLGGAMYFSEMKNVANKEHGKLSRVFSGVSAVSGGLNTVCVAVGTVAAFTPQAPSGGFFSINFGPEAALVLYTALSTATLLTLSGITGLAAHVTRGIGAPKVKDNAPTPPTV